MFDGQDQNFFTQDKNLFTQETMLRDEIYAVMEKAGTLGVLLKLSPGDVLEDVYFLMTQSMTLVEPGNEMSCDKLVSLQEQLKIAFYLNQPTFKNWFNAEQEKNLLCKHWYLLQQQVHQDDLENEQDDITQMCSRDQDADDHAQEVGDDVDVRHCGQDHDHEREPCSGQKRTVGLKPVLSHYSTPNTHSLAQDTFDLTHNSYDLAHHTYDDAHSFTVDDDEVHHQSCSSKATNDVLTEGMQAPTTDGPIGLPPRCPCSCDNCELYQCICRNGHRQDHACARCLREDGGLGDLDCRC